MSFQLLDVKDEDFDELIACLWESYENPNQSFFRLFCPIHGDGPNAREESLKASTEGMMASYKEEPESYWQKVVNEEGKIVGAGYWKIFEKNPFPEPAHEVDWYPEGETREYVSECIHVMTTPRERMGRRPHICECCPNN